MEFGAPLKTSASLRACIGALREEIPPLKEDRFLVTDIERAADFIGSGACQKFHSVHYRNRHKGLTVRSNKF